MNKNKALIKIFGLIVIACMLVATLPVGQVQAAIVDITVCADGCDFTSIQSAIDAASAGGTIIVKDGTYNATTEGGYEPEGLIKVTKPLTIKAEEDGNSTRPIIDGTGNNGIFKIYGTTFSGGDVVIEGFEIIGNAATGIAITGRTCALPNPVGFVIRDNIFDGMIAGINFWGSDGDDGELCATGGHDAIIQGIEITDNEFKNLGLTNVHQGAGILLEGLSDWDTAGGGYAAIVSDNTFTNIVANTEGEGQAVGPGLGVIVRYDSTNNQSANANVYNNTFTNVGVSQVDVDLSGPDTFYVSAGGSIQTAIDAAIAGDTINVVGGTYTERLTINKPLDLVGPNAGIDGTTGTRNPEAIITFPEGDNSEWSLIEAESNDISVNGFTFSNNQVENTSSGGWDLILVGENIEFINNRVISQAQSKIPFKIQGPIEVYNEPDNHYAGAVVKNNYFESPNTLWNTVIMQGIGASVQYNTIIGGTSGIQIQPYTNTAGGIVSHNNIAGYAHAIWHNFQIDGNGLWIYENNNLGAPIPLTTFYNYGKGSYWQGIVVQTQMPNIEVRNNTINGENDDYILNTDELYERTSLGVSYYSGLYSGSKIYVHDNEFVNVDQNVENQTTDLGNLDEVFANNTFERSAYVENSYLIYTSIQDAIDAAVDGDTILVGPGTYDEALVLDVPNLTVKSIEGAENTIIDVPDGTLTTGVKVLADMGIVTFEGFTVKDFTENGIVQGMSAHDGTIFHVLNNNVMPKADYLRNGIQVSGDGSTVIGNTIQGAPLTEDWQGSGIMVVNASDVIVKDNLVSGGDIGITIQNYSGVVSNITIQNNTVENADTGMSIFGKDGYRDISNITIDNNLFTNDAYVSGSYGVNFQTTDISDITFTDNKIQNVSYGIRVSPTSATLSGLVTLRHNQFVYNYYPILYSNDPVTFTIDAKENWWDSISGPAESGFGSIYLGTTGLVDYIPWCADAACTQLVTPVEDETELQSAFSTASSGDVIYVAPKADGEPYTTTGGFTLNVPGVTIILADGVVIQNNSPCYTVAASNTTITTESPLGAKCVPTDGSHGIIVNSGVENVTIVGLEISGINNEGVDQSTGSGIYFFDDPVNVEIVDNYIHDLDGDGIHFSATPTGGYQVIQGNLFQNNSNLGIFIPDGTLNAEYNSWGDVNGPTGTNGDGVSAVVDYEPFTHVDLYLESAGTAYSDQVVVGQTITYKVMGNLANVMGAEVTLDYPDGLTFVAPAVDDFTWCKFDSCEVIEDADGKLSLVGYQESAAKSGSAVELFEVEFTGTTAGLDQALAFDLTLDNFSMSTPSGTSNTILASGFVDAAVDVVVAPELSVEGLDGPFYVGNQVEFTLTITNPTENGGTFSEALLNFLNFAGDFEYYDGATWVTGFPSTINFTPGDVVEIEMRGTFNNPGELDLQVELYEKEVLSEQLLDTLIVENVTVYGVFDVTGSISMQGRVTKAGVPIILTHPDFGVFSVNSTNFLSDNVGFTDLPGGDYTFTTNQPRYLNVTSRTPKGFYLDENFVAIPRLELKGGNAVQDSVIDLLDAAKVGVEYGKTDTAGTNDGDVNFDMKINIQDLALVGGNYNLTDKMAYNGWSITPLPAPVVSPTEGNVNLTINDTFKLIVDADNIPGLYELEIDHNIGTLPEFSVYASGSDPYGGDENQFAGLGVTVTYDEENQRWTIDFGASITADFANNGGVTFYLVLIDDLGNQWGTMYDTTPENTFQYTIDGIFQ